MKRTRLKRTGLSNTINKFIDDFCDEYNVTLTLIQSPLRRRDLAEKRMMLSYFLRNRMGLTYQDIGNLLNRNHASIIYHVRLIEDFISHDVYFKLLHNSVEKIFNKYIDEFDDEVDMLSELYNENARLQRKLRKVESKIEMLNEKLYNEAGVV